MLRLSFLPKKFGFEIALVDGFLAHFNNRKVEALRLQWRKHLSSAEPVAFAYPAAAVGDLSCLPVI